MTRLGLLAGRHTGERCSVVVALDENSLTDHLAVADGAERFSQDLSHGLFGVRAAKSSRHHVPGRPARP